MYSLTPNQTYFLASVWCTEQNVLIENKPKVKEGHLEWAFVRLIYSLSARPVCLCVCVCVCVRERETERGKQTDRERKRGVCVCVCVCVCERERETERGK